MKIEDLPADEFDLEKVIREMVASCGHDPAAITLEPAGVGQNGRLAYRILLNGELFGFVNGNYFGNRGER